MNDTKLEKLRDSKDLTIKAIAKDLKISDSIYSRWKNNRDSIPTKILYQIANYYKINLDYLLKLTDKKYFLISNKGINLSIIPQRIRQIRQDFDKSLRVFAKIQQVQLGTLTKLGKRLF